MTTRGQKLTAAGPPVLCFAPIGVPATRLMPQGRSEISGAPTSFALATSSMPNGHSLRAGVLFSLRANDELPHGQWSAARNQQAMPPSRTCRKAINELPHRPSTPAVKTVPIRAIDVAPAPFGVSP